MLTLGLVGQHLGLSLEGPCTSLATTTPALAGKGGSSLLGAESDGEDAGGGKAEQKQQNE